jgi:hypothetical protein
VIGKIECQIDVLSRFRSLSCGPEAGHSEATNGPSSSALFPRLLKMMLCALIQTLGLDRITGRCSGTSKRHEVLVAAFVICDVGGSGPEPARSRRRVLRATRSCVGVAAVTSVSHCCPWCTSAHPILLVPRTRE